MATGSSKVLLVLVVVTVTSAESSPCAGLHAEGFNGNDDGRRSLVLSKSWALL